METAGAAVNPGAAWLASRFVVGSGEAAVRLGRGECGGYWAIGQGIDPPHDAVIVIFGAAVRPDGRPSETLRHRVAAAAGFGRRFARPLFIPTGAKGRHGDAEAIVMGRQLIDAGFEAEAIRAEMTGTDTLSSVRAVVRMVAGLGPVYACSSAYHLPRCLMLLRLAGVGARACPPPPVPAATRRGPRWYWRLREVAALPYDAGLMLWLRVTGRM